MITYHKDIIQGSDEWFAVRLGILTASEMKHILTPTLKAASNDKERSHVYELLAQRITKYVEPSYIGDDMLRGREEEIAAKIAYAKKFAPVDDIGFVTNDKWGFAIGYSPDGLVGEDGVIECKSRCQKYQIETILNGVIPAEHVLQVQTGLLVTERKWCDYISYCGGLPMIPIRIEADLQIQEAIVNAATEFEKRLTDRLVSYQAILKVNDKLVPTERRIEQEMFI